VAVRPDYTVEVAGLLLWVALMLSMYAVVLVALAIRMQSVTP